MRRLLWVAAGLAALAAAVTLGRRLTAPHVPERPAPHEPPSAAPAGPEPTRQQLYEQARQLNVQGRSRMSKEQLSQAVSERRREVS